jgi:hypothetical protein
MAIDNVWDEDIQRCVIEVGRKIWTEVATDIRACTVGDAVANARCKVIKTAKNVSFHKVHEDNVRALLGLQSKELPSEDLSWRKCIIMRKRNQLLRSSLLDCSWPSS